MNEIVNTGDVIHGRGFGDVTGFLGDDHSELNLVMQRALVVWDLNGSAVTQVRRRRFQKQHRLLKIQKLRFFN